MLTIRSFLFVGILVFALPLLGDVAPVILAPPLTTPEIAVDSAPGSQWQPTVSGGLVAYTADGPGGSVVAWFDLSSGARGTTAGPFDFWADVNDGRITFTRIVAGRSAIMLLDVATALLVELDPAPAGVNRRGSAIGGNTVAWVDLGAAADLSSNEVYVRDLATSTTTRLTNNDRMDAGVRVSADGNVVTWTSCVNFFGIDCNVVQAVRTTSGWVTTVLTGADRSEYLTATDGGLVAYDVFGWPPESDVYWQPAGGGTEMQLVLPSVQAWPGASDGVIVFHSGEVGWRDVWAYDTETALLYRVSEFAGDDTIADIDVSDNVATVVWMRLESDNDVYARRFELIRSDSPEEQLDDLRGLIAASGNHLARPLLAKLDAAAAALAAGDVAAACQALRDFLNQVAAQRGKKIPVADADNWSAAARAIRTALECG